MSSEIATYEKNLRIEVYVEGQKVFTHENKLKQADINWMIDNLDTIISGVRLGLAGAKAKNFLGNLIDRIRR